jgi:hypothetical protein
MHIPPPSSGVHVKTPFGQLTTFSLKFCPTGTETLYGTLFGLLVVEIGLRIFLPQPTAPISLQHDPALGAIPVPYQHGHKSLPGVYSYTYSNNSKGFRGPKEFQLGKINLPRSLSDLT